MATYQVVVHRDYEADKVLTIQASSKHAAIRKAYKIDENRVVDCWKKD